MFRFRNIDWFSIMSRRFRSAIEGYKVLVHGGGRSATKLASQLGIESKIKFGVSGCPLQCGEGAIRDIGVFGKKATGWTVQIGGNSGLNARVGEVLAADLEDDRLIEVLTKLMVYYKENMKPKERMYRFVPRMGKRR